MLYIHHSNSLNTLSEILLQQLSDNASSVLGAEQILVQNPGMKRWLQQQISLSCGIAANLNFPLPSRFIWDVFLSQFDEVQDLSAYDGEVLRWRLMALLQQHGDDAPLQVLRGYMVQDESALARFQLAEKLAALYDQYLVYRPRMISRWEEQKIGDSSTEIWQAYIWNLIRKQNSQPHRAELISRLIRHITRGQVDLSQLPECLYVFGITAMSPLYMDVLAALGQCIDVHIFNLNPCEHYWGDIQTKKEQMREGSPLGSENELLASLGKQGRDFIDQFYSSGFEYEDDNQFKPIVAESLLKRVQQDVLQLSIENDAVKSHDDGSIQIVSCYSELRELQVLHDRLLEMLEQDKTLQAHDIVVMCPDINTLAPYIEAVFGQQPEVKKLPFSISDQNTLCVTPLVQAILDWINLASSRISANEILGWLELPALQRAYALDENSVEIIRYWVKTCHIHWGFDESHKQRLGLAPNILNTWAHGISQLLSAYMMPDTVRMFGRHVAAESLISKAEFQALGQLHKFLDDLENWSLRLKQDANLSSWQQHINDLMDTFLDLTDEEEWMLKPVREALANWRLQAGIADYSEPLGATLIHYLLENEISRSSTQHHYLSGGINFCNLIPMRTLPFRVVCLIGMGNDRFPRTEVPLQLDLISLHPQKGDRSRREDDRYMFLQSLLSAGDTFYISYVGQSKKDDTSIEPSVVVSELNDYIYQQTGIRIGVQKTPLQAFSVKNFETGSFADQWHITSDIAQPPAFNQSIPALIAGPENDTTLLLDDLILFYKNPAKYYMQNRLNMSLQDYSESIDDDEVFTLDTLQGYQINSELLADLLVDGEVTENKYLNSGKLAEQNSGVIQFQQQFDQMSEVYREIVEHAHYSGPLHYESVISLHRAELSGRVSSLSEQGLLNLNPSSIKGRHLFTFWIQHCFLCATKKINFSELLIKDKNYKWIGLSPLDSEQAKQYLDELIEGFLLGQQSILPFYADTAYEYEKCKISKGEEAALEHIKQLWSDDVYTPFYEAMDIYIQTGLKNAHAEFLDEGFFEQSSRYMAVLLEHCKELK